MKNMKKFTALFLIPVISLALLTGCGSSSSSETTAESAGETDDIGDGSV
ncbi:MAG: hypothetical protein LUD73_01635 [Lachnospiraceae bacterium]|nr:hypothetical protein [Lachnospiraceae bacterium]